jgi:hypothetical protein
MRKLLTRPKEVAIIRIVQWCNFVYISEIFSFWADSAKVTGGDGFCLSEDKESRACLKGVSNLIARSLLLCMAEEELEKLFL